MVSLTMNLISGTHHLCGRREYAFMVFEEYIIISPKQQISEKMNRNEH